MEKEIQKIENEIKRDLMLLKLLSTKYDLIGVENMSDKDKILLSQIIATKQRNDIRLALLKTKIENAELIAH